MATIQALPPTTVRILGSSQVITNPESVVKELIDNALDANARAIFVEISSNTLDVIQLRDSGDGIAPEDRDLVCRRYCTSKIKNEEELRAIGGTWLGFRGEALTSLAELSGSLLVTTRVEGDATATALQIGEDGEVKSRATASQPVGTIVRATDLFRNLPVRKQAAQKASAKCLAKVKQTMQKYAMARPAVRFSLKVLKAKTDKGNWVYAPKPNASIEDAALKVVGNSCASQCCYHVVELDDVTVKAFLPRFDADPANITGKGHFLSVDSRPVSAACGFLKQLVDAFRERLRGSDVRFADIRDPFIWLNINCAPGSYDANVEPAKDDVIFEDHEKILRVVNTLFDACYPIVDRGTTPHRAAQVSSTTVAIYEDQEEAIDHPPSKRCRIWKPNMYIGGDDDDGDDDISMLSHSTELAPDNINLENEHPATSPNEGLNPFVIAKLNTRSSPRKPATSRTPPRPLQDLSASDVNTCRSASSLPPYPPWTLPTPEASSPTRPQQVPPPSRSRIELGFTFAPPSVVSSTDRTEQGNDATPILSPRLKNPPAIPRHSDFISALDLPPNSSPQAEPTLPTMPSEASRGRLAPCRGQPNDVRYQRSQKRAREPEPSGSYCDPLGLMPSPTKRASPRRAQKEKRNRAIDDMFVGQGVNKPFKPPRPRRQAVSEQNELSSLPCQRQARRENTDARPAGEAQPRARSRLVDEDEDEDETEETELSHADISSAFLSSDPIPAPRRGTRNKLAVPSPPPLPGGHILTPIFPFHRAPSEGLTSHVSTGPQLAFETPTDICRLIHPLKLTISAISDLTSALREICVLDRYPDAPAWAMYSYQGDEAYYAGGADGMAGDTGSKGNAANEGFGAPHSSLMDLDMESEEVRGWRAMVLRWVSKSGVDVEVKRRDG